MPKTGDARPQVPVSCCGVIARQVHAGSGAASTTEVGGCGTHLLKFCSTSQTTLTRFHLLGVIAIQTKRTVRGTELITKANRAERKRSRLLTAI